MTLLMVWPSRPIGFSKMRLSGSSSAALVSGLAYDRAKVQIGHVHLGVGAFHRAHQAVYSEACLAGGDMRWGILGASLRSPSVALALNPQDGLYHCMVRDGVSEKAQLIGAIKQVLVAPDMPDALIAKLADPAVHIVTLTITEKGYCLDPASGTLNLDDPLIATDLQNPSAPRSAPGLIVAALKLRKDRGLRPFTALSCDNLAHNGHKLAQAVVDFAHRCDPQLADWIAAEAAFPSSMVDRIVPATTHADLAAFETMYGFSDHGLVISEPFSQWVIEDKFVGDRPPWEWGGAQLTQDVGLWETAKLRLLNGTHSALAYLGGLSGFATIDQVMADPVFACYVDLLQDELESTLTAPAGLDVATYRHELKSRFANPALAHKTHQIAMDGSQKLPQRLLAPIRERLNRGQNFPCLAFAVAGWMAWQGGCDELGQNFLVDDPLALKTRALFAAGANGQDKAQSLISLKAVFAPEVAGHPDFVRSVGEALDDILRHGIHASLCALTRRKSAR